MLFGNPNKVPISKKILGVQYTCAPGEFVEIPDKVAYVIKLEGTLLVPAEELTKAPVKVIQAPVVEVEPVQAPVVEVEPVQAPVVEAANKPIQPAPQRQDDRNRTRR